MASPWELNFHHWEASSTHRKFLFTTMDIRCHIVSEVFYVRPVQHIGPGIRTSGGQNSMGCMCGCFSPFGIRTSGGVNSRICFCARHFPLSAFDKSLQHDHGYIVCACIDALNSFTLFDRGLVSVVTQTSLDNSVNIPHRLENMATWVCLRLLPLFCSERMLRIGKALLAQLGVTLVLWSGLNAFRCMCASARALSFGCCGPCVGPDVGWNEMELDEMKCEEVVWSIDFETWEVCGAN